MRLRVMAVLVCLSAATLGAQQQNAFVPIDTSAVRGIIDAESAARSVSTTSWFWRGVLWTPLYPVGIPVVIMQAQNSEAAPPSVPDQQRPREYRAAHDSAFVATVRRKRRNASFKGLGVGLAVMTFMITVGVDGR